MLPGFDRVSESSTTTGTGNFTLSGALTSSITFATVFAVNQRFYYAIITGSGEWEVGQGYLSGATTLVRERVTASSNANALVSFTVDSTVFNTLPAETETAIVTRGALIAQSLTSAGIF